MVWLFTHGWAAGGYFCQPGSTQRSLSQCFLPSRRPLNKLAFRQPYPPPRDVRNLRACRASKYITTFHLGPILGAFQRKNSINEHGLARITIGDLTKGKTTLVFHPCVYTGGTGDHPQARIS